MNLTQEQIASLKSGDTIRLRLPEAGGNVFIVLASTCENLREIIEDENHQKQIEQSVWRDMKVV